MTTITVPPKRSSLTLVRHRVPSPGPVPDLVDLDAAATTSPSDAVLQAVADFLPWYSSVHRGASITSQRSSARYEAARDSVLRLTGADPATHVAVFTRNTTEAINLIAARLDLRRSDVVVTTTAEHHANILPWRRHASLRVVDVDDDGTFSTDAVVAALDATPRPRVLAVTGGSNVTGWLPDLAPLTTAARERGVLVVVDGAQLVPHRPVDVSGLGIDVLAFSGHKMHAPFGTGALVVRRDLLAEGEPFLVGGGAVDAVSFEDVAWTTGVDREEAGSPNVVGAVALASAADELTLGSWPALVSHEQDLVAALDAELATVPGLRRLGPVTGNRLPVASFTLENAPHGLVAARLSAEFGVGVRSGCFCAHPYLSRLLGLTPAEVDQFHHDVRSGNRHRLPGAVRASASGQTTRTDVAVLGRALREIVATPEAAERYVVDEHGDHRARTD